MNREVLKNYIKNILLKRYARQYKDDSAWAWGKIKAEVPGASPAEKLEIIRAIESTSLVRRIISAEAEAEAAGMVVDDSLDLNELTRLLGDGNVA